MLIKPVYCYERKPIPKSTILFITAKPILINNETKVGFLLPKIHLTKRPDISCFTLIDPVFSASLLLIGTFGWSKKYRMLG